MTVEQLERLFGEATIVQGVFWLIAAAALATLVMKLWPAFSKFVATVNALSELPAKLALVDEIHHEVKPNTGTSLNDAVRRVEAEQKRQAKVQRDQSEKLEGLQELMETADAELSDRVGDIENTLQPGTEK